MRSHMFRYGAPLLIAVWISRKHSLRNIMRLNTAMAPEHRTYRHKKEQVPALFKEEA